MDLAYLDGKQVAIVLKRSGGPTVMRGRAQYDQRAGRLRIWLQNEPGSPEFVMDVLTEGVRAVPDTQYGSDYLIQFERRPGPADGGSDRAAP